MLLLQGLKPGSNMATSAVGYRQAMNWLLLVSITHTHSHTHTDTHLPDTLGGACVCM